MTIYDFKLPGYDKVTITNNYRLRLFYQNANINKHKLGRACDWLLFFIYEHNFTRSYK